MADRSSTPRHELGRTAVPMALVPRTALRDDLLSLSAKGLVAEAVAFGGHLPIGDVARRPVENADDVLDAVGDLLRLGYATLEVDVLVLTPVGGWAA